MDNDPNRPIGPPMRREDVGTLAGCFALLLTALLIIVPRFEPLALAVVFVLPGDTAAKTLLLGMAVGIAFALAIGAITWGKTSWKVAGVVSLLGALIVLLEFFGIVLIPSLLS